MTLCIITHVIHTKNEGKFYAYAPYVNEMNIWMKNVDKVIVVAPKDKFTINPIHSNYSHPEIEFIAIEKFNLLSAFNLLKSLMKIPTISWRIYKAMEASNHIHLRCPGNVGLIGSFVQILFPNKSKTAKYAGNWDPNSKQPLSYKIQKWILSNTFLTKKMQVLVYGEWKNQSKNVKSFFTATYKESEKTDVVPRNLSDNLKFLFVGSLTSGKQPLYAIKLMEKLKNNNHNISLSIYGYGDEREKLSEYILLHELSNFVKIKDTINRVQLIDVYKENHFLLLPTKSEGWPKVVAEAMFWGCLPIATKVSCIPNMLDDGNRGVLLSDSFEENSNCIERILQNQEVYNDKVANAIDWSRKYTTDRFEYEIKKLLL